MPQIRISTAAELLSVSDDTLRRWIDSEALTSTTDASGRKVVEGEELARFARDRAPEQPSPAGTSSARNRFVGLVTRVTSDTVMSQVEMQCGPYRVVSLMSTEAVKKLQLEPGALATASVKATTVVVESL